ncbi:MAG TPA: ATP synthase F1 subunit delta [Lacipirellulaceae bacterium]|jgi:F-type H+-transporting ATPase subunit delta|nr:ATP synthase F1 subunit delta [Lacipirellulaceae bacterium]
METADGAKVKHETVMDVTEEQVSRVYAKAFLGAIATSGNATALVEELASVVNDVLNRNPKLEQALRSSLIAEDQKEKSLGRIFGSASKEVLNFLKVLSRHGRLGLIRQVSQLATKMHAKDRGMTDVEIRVATPLDDALRNEIQSQLRKVLKTEPLLNVKVDPSLIAGMIVRVGDRVYDGSVQNQLERARAAMIDRATEQIETRPESFLVA